MQLTHASIEIEEGNFKNIHHGNLSIEEPLIEEVPPKIHNINYQRLWFIPLYGFSLLMIIGFFYYLLQK
jgi:hypothetical protein